MEEMCNDIENVENVGKSNDVEQVNDVGQANEVNDVENVENSDQANDQTVNLPCYPTPIFDMKGDGGNSTEDADCPRLKALKYTGDETSLENRMRWKVWLLWLYWSALRNDEKIVEILLKKHDRDSDTFFLCNTILNIFDQLARILITTPLVDEVLPNAKPVVDVAVENPSPDADVKTQT